jgi:hypothetical protein
MHYVKFELIKINGWYEGFIHISFFSLKCKSFLLSKTKRICEEFDISMEVYNKDEKRNKLFLGQ